MAITCIDSSAILRVCFGEGETTAVTAALSGSPAASALATVEVPIGIAARLHRGLITQEQHDHLIAIAHEILERTARLALTRRVQHEAVLVGQRFLVRALDAIHIASAAVLLERQSRQGRVVRFCTADIRQAEVARALLGEAHVDLVPPLQS